MTVGELASAIMMQFPPIVVRFRAHKIDVARLQALASHVHGEGTGLQPCINPHPFGAVPVYEDNSLPPGVCEADFTDGNIKRLQV